MEPISATMLRRQLRSFRENPIAYTRSKSKVLASLPFQWRAEFELRRRGCLDFLKTRPPGAFAPDYPDLWFLYRTARRVRPTLLVEFGAGCSTFVLASALKHNGGGRLLSLDADQQWATAAAAGLGQELAPYCEVRHSPLSVMFAPGGEKLFVHDALPAGEVPQMVYLDGPALTDEVRGAGDVLALEPRLQPGFVLVVDGRADNVRILRSSLRRTWRITPRPFFRNTMFELER
jgi:hypothetical protein